MATEFQKVVPRCFQWNACGQRRGNLIPSGRSVPPHPGPLPWGEGETLDRLCELRRAASEVRGGYFSLFRRGRAGARIPRIAFRALNPRTGARLCRKPAGAHSSVLRLTFSTAALRFRGKVKCGLNSDMVPRVSRCPSNRYENNPPSEISL